MRLLVDEDIASEELLTRLREAGHHVEKTEKGVLDRAVWQRAQDAQLIVVTGNPDDFISQAGATPGHHGLLVVYGERDPIKQMRAADIAAAIEHLRDVHGETLRDARLVLNEWRRPRASD